MELQSLPDSRVVIHSREARVRRLWNRWVTPDSTRTVLSIADQFVFSGMSFATAVIVGRACPKQSLGVFFLAMTLVKFVRSFQGYIISAPYSIFSQRQDDADLPAYTGSVLGHQLGVIALTMIGLSCVLLIPTGGLISAHLNQTVFILLLCVPFILMYSQLRRIVFARMRMHVALCFDAGIAVVQLTALILLWRSEQLTPQLVIIVMAATLGTACLVWFLTKQQSFTIQSRRVISDFRDNWRFGRWALAGFLVGQTAVYLLPWVIAFAHGEAATGILAACITLANLVGTFVTGVGNFAGPRAAKSFATGGSPALCRFLRKIGIVYLAVAGSFCLFVLATGDLIVRLVYSEAYAGTGAILVVLAFQVLFNSISITAGNGLWAMDQPRASFIADVGTVLVTLTTLTLLVMPLGVLGAAIALLCGTIAGAAIRTTVFVRLVKT